MKYIKKSAEPEEWKQFCSTEDVCFDDMRANTRDALKAALLMDQGYICCYCGKRIFHEPNTILEHLLPREHYRDLAIKYSNLLCSCDGGQSVRSRGERYPVFCDNKKGDKVLPVTPLDFDCEEQFRYEDDGTITPLSDNAAKTINILNLGDPVLKNLRKAAVNAYRDISYAREKWERVISTYESRDENGFFEEYCFVLVNYIRNYKLI